MVKKIIQVVMALVIVGLAYLVYDSIMQPIRFNKQKELRESAIIKRLKDIRNAEIAYKAVHDKYVGSFDTLINFIDSGKFALVLKIGNPDDSTAEIIRDTTFIGVKDSIFHEDFAIDSIKYIPYSQGKKFNLYAKQIVKQRVKVSVFCASAIKKDYMEGLDKNFFEEEDSIYVGSLEEPTSDGNWE